MITPSHIIYSWALAKKTEVGLNTKRTGWFILGGVIPDAPVFIFFIIHGAILGTSGSIMWNELYFDSSWSIFFTLSHSWLVWPTLLVLGIFCKRQWLVWLSTTATLHVVMDFFVHHDDAYRHLWPLSDWQWMSPVSYWDPQHYGPYVGLLDTVVILLLLVWLYKKADTHLSIQIVSMCLFGVYVLLGAAEINRLLL